MSYPITSGFKAIEKFRNGKPHLGLDFAMPKNSPIISTEHGRVIDVVDYGNANIGKGLMVQWDNGKIAIYGHLNEVKVKAGEIVDKGDLLGLSGNTGNVVGANGGYHLHFGLKNERGEFIDPSPYAPDISNMDTMNVVHQHSEGFSSIFSNYSDSLLELINELASNFISLIHNAFSMEIVQNIIQFFFFYT